MGRARELHEAVMGGDERAALDNLYREAEPHMDKVDEAKGGNIDRIATKLERVIGEELRRYFPDMASRRQHMVAAEAAAAAKRKLMMNIVESSEGIVEAESEPTSGPGKDAYVKARESGGWGQALATHIRWFEAKPNDKNRKTVMNSLANMEKYGKGLRSAVERYLKSK